MFVMRLRSIMPRNYLWKHFSVSNLKESNVNDVKDMNVPKPELDLNYLCDPKNKEEIQLNINKRKGVGDIQRVQELYSALSHSTCKGKDALEQECLYEALKIPNRSHPDIQNYGEEPKRVRVIHHKTEFPFKAYEFDKIAKHLNLIRTENLGNFCGQRSYVLLSDLAEMEQALINFTVDTLMKKNFKVVSVPDVLPRQVIEACGMSTRGARTQVYELDSKLHPPDMILSGTSEMALAGYLMNKTFLSDELPIRLTAVSRCYRAEISSIAEEKGIYRVHQFTKVEMFGVTDQKYSETLLEEFLEIQEQMFRSLGLCCQTMDMPPHELGAPACRKYDVEAWLPGRLLWGEVSSCSNCTDYQSRRLNIKYQSPKSKEPLHVHTVNGTACAIPRMLIAIFETYQNNNNTVAIPDVLQPYMKGKKVIERKKSLPIKVIKTKNLRK